MLANPEVRRKVALKIAEFLLPKADKKAKIIPDEYGFSINPNLASAYRDIQLELRALVNGPTRKIPAMRKRSKNWRRVPMRSDGGSNCRVPPNMAKRNRSTITPD